MGERPIFQREYAVGLSPGVYFTSKVLVLGSAAFVQGLVVTFLATVGLPGADGSGGTFRVAIAIALLSWTMVVIGLALSALVTRLGADHARPGRTGDAAGSCSPARSSRSPAGSAWSRSPGSRRRAGAMPRPPRRSRLTDGFSGTDKEDWIAESGAAHYLMDLMVLGLLGVLAFGVGLLLVRRSATSDG
ncbi:ABC transporter permease [Nocardioides sp. W3-2-3]|uniref:ABC transporter permease n=1 Tax=Nocardioides convexus TaxID=2712224 RepID=UPI00241830FA|nr:ABC transporter permease [Nocardioides convexus]NHA00421.1 ABC transporter permease [Nocardioides convexus]